MEEAETASSSVLPPPSAPPSKPPIVRGAKACTVCRAAKMRCIGAEEGGPCNRCKKQNTECVFEKHRRGRKPGSKLSEASKMLRRLEKGLNSAKANAQSHQDSGESSRIYPSQPVRPAPLPEPSHDPAHAANGIPVTSSNTQWQSPPVSQLPPGLQQPPVQQHVQYITIPEYQSNGGPAPSAAPPSGPASQPTSHKRRSWSPPDDKDQERLKRQQRSVSNLRGTDDETDMEGSSADDEDVKAEDSSDYNLFPARLLAEENKRNSFFKTILNPPGSAAAVAAAATEKGRLDHRKRGSVDEGRSTSTGSNGHYVEPGFMMRPKKVPEFEDPITAGLITEEEAKALFELFFLRLNPFICLFDPVLHTVEHVRSTCPFLFCCIIMAGCKFWKPHLYPACQQLAADASVKAFQYGLKSVGIVQSFACMTYWKEPDDTNTWTYIGYACRMAVELGLNRHVAKPPEEETDERWRERRDRERTYLVLFVHDRSLSMQTGRQWMLPEDDLVRNSATWHEGKHRRPEDVIVAAQVQLRRIAAETTDVFYLHKGQPGMLYSDINYELLLRGFNAKLTNLSQTWQAELVKAEAQSFHSSVLSFFRLHVRLFLNSFGLQSSMQTASRETPSLQALSNCYTSALQTLEIVTAEFAPIGMLRYVQDSITVMTAYSAVFLLRLLRHASTLSDLHEEATRKIYDLISQTADVYQEAALMASSSGSAGYHARFLRSLVAKDLADKARAAERKANKARDAESNSGSSVEAHSPNLLSSPTNVIPTYHPPGPPGPPAMYQNQYGSSETIASTSTTTLATMAPLPEDGNAIPFVVPPQPGGGYGGIMPDVINNDMQSYEPVLAAPIHMQDGSYQYSSYPRQSSSAAGAPLNNNSLDFRQYPPSSPWEQQQPVLADSYGQPEYQQLNGVSDADIHYWRHMFVNLGFGNGQ